MEKYGKEHFAMDVLEHHKFPSKDLLLQRLDEREIALIEKFDSYYHGLNSTKGGRGALEHQMRPVQRFDLDGNFVAEYNSVESLKKEFDSVSTIYDCCLHNNAKYAYGSLWRYKDDDMPLPVLNDSEKAEALVRYKAKLGIDEYDYTGNLLHEYVSIEELLSENPGVKRYQIINCCTGKIVYVGIKVYRFHGESFNSFKTYRDKSKLVEQYDLNGNFINVFESVRKACKAVGLKGTQISGVCNGKNKTAGGYIWKYVEDKLELPDLRHNRHCVKVYQYRKDTLELDKIFDSIKEAGEYNKITSSSISMIAKGERKSICYNYIWSFEELSNVELLEKINNKNNKPVVRLDIEGNYIDEYISMKDEARQLFPDKKNAGTNIGAAIRENRIAYGYRWILKNDYIEEVKYA